MVYLNRDTKRQLFLSTRPFIYFVSSNQATSFTMMQLQYYLDYFHLVQLQYFGQSFICLFVCWKLQWLLIHCWHAAAFWKNPSDLVISVVPFACLQCIVTQLLLMMKEEWFFCCDPEGYENDLFDYSICSLPKILWHWKLACNAYIGKPC